MANFEKSPPFPAIIKIWGNLPVLWPVAVAPTPTEGGRERPPPPRFKKPSFGFGGAVGVGREAVFLPHFPKKRI